MLVTTLCWWFYDSDLLKMLATESLSWRFCSLCWWIFQCVNLSLESRGGKDEIVESIQNEPILNLISKFFLATDSVVIIWIALCEYEYDVVFGKKWSYSYFTHIKIRVDTTLYQYDLICKRPEKIQWGRIPCLLVFFGPLVLCCFVKCIV